MRGDSKKLEIAFRLARLIEQLNELVFKDKVEIWIIKRRPRAGESFAFFIPAEESKKKKDHYKIIGYLSEVIPREVRKYRHISESLEKEWNQLPPFTEEELLVAIAAHEVRHRVQRRLGISLFSSRDSANVDNAYLKILIAFLKRLFEIEPRKEGEIEFDAKVIEWWAAKVWHEKKNLMEVAQIVKQKADLLLKN